MPPTVSTVICAYTEARFEDLRRAVRSVESQSVPPLEILVVSDHNPELLERVLGEIPAARAVANREERGLSGARNSGVATARGSVVAFLDDDAVASPDWLERLTGGYADRRVMGVGGTVEPAWPAGRPQSFPAEFDWVVGCTYRGLPTATRPVRNLIGANMSLRREVFELVGGFRSGLGRVGTVPAGCEETELCIRVQQQRPGSVFLFEPSALVRHRVPAERATWAYFRARCFAEGRSKAIVAAQSGMRDGLASERAHTLTTLPRGVRRGLGDAVVRGDRAGLGRAAAILGGLAVTMAGYVAESATARRDRRRGDVSLISNAVPSVAASQPPEHSAAEVSVVVPVLNAERLVEACLESILRCTPHEVIVVDGQSTDRTLELVRRYPVRLLSDDGGGLPAARLAGARAATTRWVALVDADVVLPEDALVRLLDELVSGGYAGLQAGLESVAGPGYWGQALARHHRWGRSRGWFGLGATILERRLLLEHGFDARFLSGEDIDLRWRLRRAGAKLGVSRVTSVEHRFGDTFEFARGQWLADGHGLGRMVAAHGPRAWPLVGLPLAAGVRGLLLSLLRREPRWLPYYLSFAAYNYVGLFAELGRGLRSRVRG